jgi:hypothetical protein
MSSCASSYIHKKKSAMIRAVKSSEIADRQYTIEHYLERSKREALPLALGFLQSRNAQKRPIAGPLSHFVRRGRETALEQYLLLHAIASGEQEGFDVRLGAATWARAIGGYFNSSTGVIEPAALHAVSRNWRFLRDLKLIETERVGRQVRARLLADDGSGKPYQHIGAGMKGKRLGGSGYLKLPYEYWRQRWHENLSLSAKAMLLIALYQGDGFSLPYNKVPEWYGISAATGERGLRELRHQGLLHRERHRRPDPESPVGFSDVYHYQLLAPFGPRGRDSTSKPKSWKGPAGSKPPKKKARKRTVKRQSAKGRAR